MSRKKYIKNYIHGDGGGCAAASAAGPSRLRDCEYTVVLTLLDSAHFFFAISAHFSTVSQSGQIEL